MTAAPQGIPSHEAHHRKHGDATRESTSRQEDRLSRGPTIARSHCDWHRITPSASRGPSESIEQALGRQRPESARQPGELTRDQQHPHQHQQRAAQPHHPGQVAAGISGTRPGSHPPPTPPAGTAPRVPPSRRRGGPGRGPGVRGRGQSQDATEDRPDARSPARREGHAHQHRPEVAERLVLQVHPAIASAGPPA